jgi:hypothetical protein
MWRLSSNELSPEMTKGKVEHESLYCIRSDNPRTFDFAKSDNRLSVGTTGDHEIGMNRAIRIRCDFFENLAQWVHKGTGWMEELVVIEIELIDHLKVISQ